MHMYNANVLAHVILAQCRRARAFTPADRDTIRRLLPRLSGMVFVLATLALRYYSVEVG
jgi:hypothetical protein